MNLIVACTPGGGIGYQNRLPWNKIEGDLPRFKSLTTGHPVVMGRNTWDSLPKKPLPGRINYVLTSKPVDGATRIEHLSDLGGQSTAWIIGGAKVIESCWDFVSIVHLTTTFTEYTCDTYIDLVKLYSGFDCRYNEINSDHTYQVWYKR